MSTRARSDVKGGDHTALSDQLTRVGHIDREVVGFTQAGFASEPRAQGRANPDAIASHVTVQPAWDPERRALQAAFVRTRQQFQGLSSFRRRSASVCS